MAQSKYYDGILAYITDHGASGVNELGKALSVPATTLQKYLTTQTYFKKTEDRKWDLPHRVNSDIKANTVTLMVDSVETSLKLLQAQMADIVQNMDNALIPISTLKRGVEHLTTSVADSSSDLDYNVLELNKTIRELYVVFDKFVKKVPEEYQNLLINFNIGRYAVNEGLTSVRTIVGPEITSLFTEESDILSDEVVEILKNYQKDQTS